MVYTVAEVKNKLPELIKLPRAGVRVTITKRGVPVVEIVRRVDDTPRKRRFGVPGQKKVVLDPEWARPAGRQGRLAGRRSLMLRGYLVDTHVEVEAGYRSMPEKVRHILEDPDVELLLSVVSEAEVAVKDVSTSFGDVSGVRSRKPWRTASWLRSSDNLT